MHCVSTLGAKTIKNHLNVIRINIAILFYDGDAIYRVSPIEIFYNESLTKKTHHSSKKEGAFLYSN